MKPTGTERQTPQVPFLCGAKMERVRRETADACVSSGADTVLCQTLLKVPVPRVLGVLSHYSARDSVTKLIPSE